MTGMVAAVLLCEAFTLARDGDAMATGRGYNWMRAITPNEHFWGGIFLGFGVLTLLGPYVPHRAFRLLVVGTVAVLLTALGVAFYRASPLGLGWILFGVPAAWKWGRLATLLWRPWRTGRD